MYAYVGPPDLPARVASTHRGAPIVTATDPFLDDDEPFTFVVDLTGTLRLAPRRSEHVACAGGEPVLSAGEITFRRGRDGRWEATEVSNQSTGYCPDTASWPAVAAALDRAGLAHPGGFTDVFVFRHCPHATSSTSSRTTTTSVPAATGS